MSTIERQRRGAMAARLAPAAPLEPNAARLVNWNGTGVARPSCMRDERQESTREGIAPAPESAIGAEAAEQRRRELVKTPPEAQPDSAMGGTSDVDSPADDAATAAALRGDQQ
jgi:hypothetical protein